MVLDYMNYLYNKPEYLEYLRYHPEWYKVLYYDPSMFDSFLKEASQKLNLTLNDKLSSINKKINMASGLLKYINKL